MILFFIGFSPILTERSQFRFLEYKYIVKIKPVLAAMLRLSPIYWGKTIYSFVLCN